MGELIGMIIAGAIIGALARLFMKGSQPLSVVWTIILGIGGVLLGNVVSGWLGVQDTAGIDWIRWIISIVMAIILISIYLAVTNKNSTRR